MEIHLLNGDALKAQFPPEVAGELVVMRECLMDGDVQGNSLPEILQTRARFLEEAYGVAQEAYLSSLEPELEKLQQLTEADVVNLWFEDDLFCQVNLWFTADVLHTNTKVRHIWLVRPDTDHRYGFGGMSHSALEKAYHERMRIDEPGLQALSRLWRHYQAEQIEAMEAIAAVQQSNFPFLTDAVAAHRDRIPTAGRAGRPQRTLLAIMEELGTDEFGTLFREFWKREPVYGYGDLQLKRLLDELSAERV